MSERKHGVIDDPIPDVQYVAKPYQAPYPPVAQLTRWKLLQAAKRTGISDSLWAKVDFRAIPTGVGLSLGAPSVQLPDFDIMMHSEANWKREAVALFTSACNEFLEYARRERESCVANGILFPVKRPRSGGGNAPLELRYEWAVQRFLLNTDYKDLAKPPFKDTQVKQAVREILKLAELNEK